MDKNEILQAIKTTVKQIMPSGTRVILFGSQARGDAREDSDWDILILLNKEKLSMLKYIPCSIPQKIG